MFQPPLPDRGGRGAVCEQIDRLVHEIKRVGYERPTRDSHELGRLFHRLDQARERLHRLYPDFRRPAEEHDGARD